MPLTPNTERLKSEIIISVSLQLAARVSSFILQRIITSAVSSNLASYVDT